MIKVLKASAGSGKTFNLAKTYIWLLLGNEDPHAYRHILAVTFTNKATDEMKSRILRELHRLSTDPGKSKYAGEFIPSLFASESELKKKAENVLFAILHDYSAFAISTIDRFFQQTLKAFSREIGQFSSYQVELDKKSLVRESVDRILDSLTEDNKPLLAWLSDSMMEQLEEGKRIDLADNLTKMAERLKSDEHREITERYGIDDNVAYSKENLSRMKVLLRGVMADCVKEMKDAVKGVYDAFDSCGVSPFETSSHFAENALSKFAGMDSRSGFPELLESFRKKSGDFSSWFRRADQPRYAHLESVLLPPAERLVSVYDGCIKIYSTAKTIARQINGLGIAADLQKEFQDLLKEKNVLSLDDSNIILKNIIDGSDAPFIYEKMGVRFEHFLLDEFQDTSRVQWENFRPLISNSDSQNFENLLVGDVKQSIYRWRGSDWKLMAKEVGEQFPESVEDSLKGNWRSLKNIVGFNHEFFAYASGRLDSLYNKETDISVSSIYGKKDDSLFEQQVVMTDDPAPGSVEAIFCKKEDQKEHVLETIRKVLSAGAMPGDITILVRKNDIGSEIAGFLMENGMDVISDDSLSLKSSSMVRKIVSLICSVKNPGDTIGSYLASKAGLDAGNVSYHSLTDLCEQLIRLLSSKEDAETFRDETLYIQSFMDYVQDHVSVNGNSLDSFLKAWDEDDPKVSSPADMDAVRIMTIHKAKGLEFPYVIIPYSENVDLFRQTQAWTVPDVAGTPLEGIGKAAFDVNLSSGSGQTLFAKEYQKELLLQYIDNINTFYVALTRASKGMTIISDIAAKPDKNFAGILRSFLESKGTEQGFSVERDDSTDTLLFRKGELYDFKGLERSGDDVAMLEPGYPSFPPDQGRLRISPDSVDFFTEEGMARAEARQNGTVLHDILSRVKVPSDLEASVLQAVREGVLEAGRTEGVSALLSERIASHPEWFPETGAKILNESSLIDFDGREWRPDRVVIKDGAVTVIDYKFGEHNSRYKAQVNRYASIYRRLGYKAVSTAIWYVFDDKVD